jgi:hypothetical protein
MAPRWGQGYMHGCLAQKTMERAETRRQRRAYADDVGILTNTLSDLQVQAHKQQLLRLGCDASQRGKTIVSGVLT